MRTDGRLCRPDPSRPRVAENFLTRRALRHHAIPLLPCKKRTGLTGALPGCHRRPPLFGSGTALNEARTEPPLPPASPASPQRVTFCPMSCRHVSFCLRCGALPFSKTTSYNRPIQLKLYDKLLSEDRCQVAGTRPTPQARERAQSQPLHSKFIVIQNTEVKTTKKITCKDLDVLWVLACIFEYVQGREHSAYGTDPQEFNLTCLISPRVSPVL